MNTSAHIDVATFEANAAAAARLMRALANERRLMILCKLTEGERSVGALQSQIGLSQSALSQHLALLRDEGIDAPGRPDDPLQHRRRGRLEGHRNAGGDLLPDQAPMLTPAPSPSSVP
jgi:predicted ArsR family transcriptional regulator